MTLPAETDELLYRRLLRGDSEACAALINRYNAPLFRFLYRQIGDTATAEDLLQETFTRLITHQGKPPDHFKAWLYTIARNLAHDHFRSIHVQREESPSLMFDLVDPVALDELAIDNAAREEVTTCLQRLSPEHREVLILRFYDDLKVEEIAEITGTAAGTVKSRLFHALRYLKSLLAASAIPQRENS